MSYSTILIRPVRDVSSFRKTKHHEQRVISVTKLRRMRITPLKIATTKRLRPRGDTEQTYAIHRPFRLGGLVHNRKNGHIAPLNRAGSIRNHARVSPSTLLLSFSGKHDPRTRSQMKFSSYLTYSFIS